MIRTNYEMIQLSVYNIAKQIYIMEDMIHKEEYFNKIKYELIYIKHVLKKKNLIL